MIEDGNISGIPFESVVQMERNFKECFDFSTFPAPTIYTLISVLSLICKDFSKKELEYDEDRIIFIFEDNDYSENKELPSIYRRYIVEVCIKKGLEYSLKIILNGKVYFREDNGSDVSVTITETESTPYENTSLAHFILHGINRISGKVREELLEILHKFGEKLNERC